MMLSIRPFPPTLLGKQSIFCKFTLVERQRNPNVARGQHPNNKPTPRSPGA
ncbi:MAG: hypothetical protein AAF490_18450 [Chloroflexota bacterium]